MVVQYYLTVISSYPTRRYNLWPQLAPSTSTNTPLFKDSLWNGTVWWCWRLSVQLFAWRVGGTLAQGLSSFLEVRCHIWGNISTDPWVGHTDWCEISSHCLLVLLLLSLFLVSFPLDVWVFVSVSGGGLEFFINKGRKKVLIYISPMANEVEQFKCIYCQLHIILWSAYLNLFVHFSTGLSIFFFVGFYLY